jgi:hypothetical protein
VWKQNSRQTAYSAALRNEKLIVFVLILLRIHLEMFLSRVSQDSLHKRKYDLQERLMQFLYNTCHYHSISHNDAYKSLSTITEEPLQRRPGFSISVHLYVNRSKSFVFALNFSSSISRHSKKIFIYLHCSYLLSHFVLFSSQNICGGSPGY